jgi:hypothetical protein
MSVRFASASSQYLVNTSPPVVAPPMTVGFWFNKITAVDAFMWDLNRVATTAHYMAITCNATNVVTVVINDAGGGLTITGATVALNQWHYVLFRAFSAANYWLSVLPNTGAVSRVQSTTSKSPAALDRAAIGCYLSTAGAPGNQMNGMIAEFFQTDTDVQGDGLTTDIGLLHQIAYRGPFSLPNIVNDIVDYRSFRSPPSGERHGESYAGKKGRQVWTPTNGPTLEAHCPLFGGYRGPPHSQSDIVIPV